MVVLVGHCFCTLLIAVGVIHDAITLPLEPSLDVPQGDRQDEREGGSLSDEDFMHALDPNFVDTKEIHDENMDPNLFEGDIENYNEETAAARSVVTGQQWKWPKKNGIVSVPFTFPSGLDSKTKAEIARVVQEYKDKTCIRYVFV